MNIPAKSDPRWRDLLTGKSSPAFSSLATKLLVTRLRQAIQKEPAALPGAVDEIHGFFSSNAFAARDLPLL